LVDVDDMYELLEPMSMQSLSNLANWFFYKNFDGCKYEIFDVYPKYEKYEEQGKNCAEDFAKKLYDLNCYSLKQKYGDENFKEFEFKKPEIIDEFQALKSVRCWLYQCVEGVTGNRKLFRLMQTLERVILNGIVMRLDRYKNAKWDY